MGCGHGACAAGESPRQRIPHRKLRNFRYECNGGHDENYEVRTVNVDQLESAEFIVVPFATQPDLAHTMMK